MSHYKVSIIVPVYNGEKYLAECLDSIIDQTLDGIEIVIVNDGSTDNSAEIIENYARKHPNIVVITQENKGIPLARMEGYTRSTGAYIGWVDDDDFIEKNMYEKLYTCAIENQADYVYCDYSFFPQKAKHKEKWFKEYKGIVDWHFIERNTHPWNKLVSRELCEAIHIKNKLPVFSDSVYVDLLVHANRIVCIKEELYHYRVGHASVSGSYKGKLAYYEEVAKRAKKQRVFIEDTKYKDSLKEYFEYRYIYALLQLCVVSALNADKDIYNKARCELQSIGYRKNHISSPILVENFGKIKAFILYDIIPKNYYVAEMICSIAFKNH